MAPHSLSDEALAAQTETLNLGSEASKSETTKIEVSEVEALKREGESEASAEQAVPVAVERAVQAAPVEVVQAEATQQPLSSTPLNPQAQTPQIELTPQPVSTTAGTQKPETRRKYVSKPLRTISPELVLEEHPIDEIPSIKVIVVGAGISGINAGILLPAKVPGIELVILERHPDIGGVWYSNVYPGVKCDIPSDVYQSTFSPKTDWSENYAPGSEIQKYYKELAQKYDIEKYIQYGTFVNSATWNEEKAKWLVSTTVDGEDKTEEADFFIVATGHFSEPRLPDYPGRDEYEGHLRHSSNWDPSFVPDGKKIAVIGNGASGLQVVPQLQKVASHLDHYARSKTWIAGSFGGEDLIRGPGRQLPPQEPEAYLAHRKTLEEGSWSRFSTIIKDSERNKASKEAFFHLMKKRLADREDLLERITPDFSPNCRRLTPGPGYLEAIQEDNVGLISTPIERFTKTGIRTTDGHEHDYDAIICSTGADIQFTPPFPVIAGDIDLNRDWRPDGKIGFPDSYLGVGAPNFPNFIIMLGPNSTGLGGTVPHAIENQLTYVAKILRKVSGQGIRTITPTQEAVNDFRAYCESFFPRTVMSEHCSSWYNGGIPGGRIHGLWPGSGTHVTQARRDVRWEDFKYTYKNPQGNRFAYLGNGFSKKDEAATVADKLDLSINFTPYLKVESVRGEVDLKALHESWYEI